MGREGTERGEERACRESGGHTYAHTHTHKHTHTHTERERERGGERERDRERERIWAYSKRVTRLKG